jgi:DNA-binding NarL/FixJ family response regulator
MAGNTTPGALLTKRQLEVARLAATGLTDKQIADHLRISTRTVQSHLWHTYIKTGTGRAGLTEWLAGRAG